MALKNKENRKFSHSLLQKIKQKGNEKYLKRLNFIEKSVPYFQTMKKEKNVIDIYQNSSHRRNSRRSLQKRLQQLNLNC